MKMINQYVHCVPIYDLVPGTIQYTRPFYQIFTNNIIKKKVREQNTQYLIKNLDIHTVYFTIWFYSIIHVSVEIIQVRVNQINKNSDQQKPPECEFTVLYFSPINSFITTTFISKARKKQFSFFLIRDSIILHLPQRAAAVVMHNMRLKVQLSVLQRYNPLIDGREDTIAFVIAYYYWKT